MLLMVTQDERMAFSARLNTALDDIGVPSKHKGRQAIVGTMFGVSQKGARKWLEGESIPATRRLPSIAKELRVRTEWLLSGNGPKHEESKVLEPSGIYATFENSESLQNMLDALRVRLSQLSDDDRRDVMNIVSLYVSHPVIGKKLVELTEAFLGKNSE